MAGRGQQTYEETLRERIADKLDAAYQKEASLKSEEGQPNSLRAFEKQVMLQIVDNLWKEHSATMDHLRQGIHLRGYAQKPSKSTSAVHPVSRPVGQHQGGDHQGAQFGGRQEEEVEAMEAQRRQQAEQQAAAASYQHASAESLEGEAASGEQADQSRQLAQPLSVLRPRWGATTHAPVALAKIQAMLRKLA